MEKAGYETSAYATEKAGDATIEAERALSSHYDLLIAAGGDGTLNEVVNGIAEQPNRPKLGIIPMGTVNDFDVHYTCLTTLWVQLMSSLMVIQLKQTLVR